MENVYSPENIVEGKVQPEIKSIFLPDKSEKKPPAELLRISQTEINEDGLLNLSCLLTRKHLRKLPDEIRLGKFNLTLINSLRDLGHLMGVEFKKQVKMDKKDRLWLTMETKKEGKDGTIYDEWWEDPLIWDFETITVIDYHNHPRAGEGFSSTDLESQHESKVPIRVVACDEGDYISLNSIARFNTRKRIKSRDEIWGGKRKSKLERKITYLLQDFNEARLKSNEKKILKSVFGQEYDEDQNLEYVKHCWQHATNVQRLSIQEKLAKLYGFQIYFVKKGEDMARRIV